MVRAMRVFSNVISREKLKPGDHIYSWRTAYIYAHHGIFIGDDMVIHFTRAAGQEMGTGNPLDKLIMSSSPVPTDTICKRCGDQSKLHGVIQSCIDCFLAGGNVYLYEYGVSPVFFIAKVRGGTCTMATSDPPEQVVHRARTLLVKGFGMYSLSKKNCEHFAIYCKASLIVGSTNPISENVSNQLASWTTAASTLLSISLPYLNPSGTLIYAGAAYSYKRYAADIGVRQDVVRISVDDLSFE